MRLLGFDITRARPTSRRSNDVSINSLLTALRDQYDTVTSGQVGPSNAERSPTVKAAVNAVTSRISTFPVGVVRKSTVDGRERTERQPDHPVNGLLVQPNDRLNSVTWALDAYRQNMLYGEYIAVIVRGRSGPPRALEPVPPTSVSIMQHDDLTLTYRVTLANGRHEEYESRDILHVRGASKDGIRGRSPIHDIRTAIAVDINAETLGEHVFSNAAMPTLVLKHSLGVEPMSEEARAEFLSEFNNTFRSRSGRFSSLFLPDGIELGDPIAIDYEKAQFLQTRQYQRTVIAGALNVPLSVVGDMSKATFSNSEEQSRSFIANTILPYVRQFEEAMTLALFSPDERRSGFCVRFDIDAALRANFRERQEGRRIQREMGVISANDWRESEGLNPLSDDDGGNVYWQQGPSGQNMSPSNDDTGAIDGGELTAIEDETDDVEETDDAA